MELTPSSATDNHTVAMFTKAHSLMGLAVTNTACPQFSNFTYARRIEKVPV
jgi:hypothetical protein